MKVLLQFFKIQNKHGKKDFTGSCNSSIDGIDSPNILRIPFFEQYISKQPIFPQSHLGPVLSMLICPPKPQPQGWPPENKLAEST